MTHLRDFQDALDLMSPDSRERWDERMGIVEEACRVSPDEAARICLEMMAQEAKEGR